MNLAGWTSEVLSEVLMDAWLAKGVQAFCEKYTSDEERETHANARLHARQAARKPAGSSHANQQNMPHLSLSWHHVGSPYTASI